MIDKSRMVHVVFLNPDGKKMWFVKTDRRLDPKTGQALTFPVADDDPRYSVPMTFEYADVSKRLWSNPPFNLNVRLSLAAGPAAEFIDEGSALSSFPWEFRDVFVTCRETGEPLDGFDAPFCLKVRAVNTPEGRKFCLRADQPSLSAPSVFVPFEEGPEAVVEKAWSLGFRGYSVVVNPAIERSRVEAEIKAQRAATAQPKNIRPGDRN
jgi:hypothetical protein